MTWTSANGPKCPVSPADRGEFMKPSSVSEKPSIERDPDYDFTPPLPKIGEIQRPKGRQCGECGMKFEYGKSYGFCCPNTRCPTGWNYT